MIVAVMCIQMLIADKPQHCEPLKHTRYKSMEHCLTMQEEWAKVRQALKTEDRPDRVVSYTCIEWGEEA